MRHLDCRDLLNNVDITSDFGTYATEFDNFGSRILKRVDRGARRQPVVERRAHYRKRRANVDKRIANQHSVDH